MTGSDWAVVVVAVISLIGALLSARSAKGAAKYNVEAAHASARASAETEAYNRARAMDVKTIERQDEEIEELQKENRELKVEFKKLKAEHRKLQLEYQTVLEETQILKRHVARLQERKDNEGG